MPRNKSNCITSLQELDKYADERLGILNCHDLCEDMTCVGNCPISIALSSMNISSEEEQCSNMPREMRIHDKIDEHVEDIRKRVSDVTGIEEMTDPCLMMFKYLIQRTEISKETHTINELGKPNGI